MILPIDFEHKNYKLRVSTIADDPHPEVYFRAHSYLGGIRQHETLAYAHSDSVQIYIKQQLTKGKRWKFQQYSKP